jgi:glycine amidinotransferase
LFKEYFDQGAKWTSAPKPPLRDSLYNYDYSNPVGERSEEDGFIINESEIVFDAADFARCGKDIFVTKSNATNDAGIEWVRRHLGEDYNVHVLLSRDPKALHIDTTFVPLAPGKALINPYYLDTKKLPSILKSWDLLVAQDPDIVKGGTLGGIFNEYAAMTSMWININGLMLDEKRVICEASQVSMIKAFKDWGFEPIPCKFLNFSPYGGTFHCATLDIRRRGKLESYF